jgi:hypothetical protein
MENNELIESFRSMIDELKASQEELKSKLDGILDEANNAKHSYDKSQFVERNKDFFDKYKKKVDAIENNPDFDFEEVAFTGKGDDMEEAEYIAALSAKLDEQLNKMKEALNADDLTIESNEEGETTIVADGEEQKPEEEEVKESEPEKEPEEEEEKEEEKKDDDIEKLRSFHKNAII